MVPAAACEPEARPQEPAAEGKHPDYAHCDGGVVEGLLGDGVDGWQAEDDGDECDLCCKTNVSLYPLSRRCVKLNLSSVFAVA